MEVRLVTDNVQDEAILSHALRLVGAKVIISPSLADLLASWSQNTCDLIVVSLRPADAPALVREVRRSVIIPLIMIVDAVTEDMHVAIVDAGADLVLVRPYSMRQLIAYAKALLRRSITVQRDVMPTLRYESVRLNPATRTVTVDVGAPQRLSQLEYRLLHTLMLHQGQILPTDTIVEHVWGYTGEGDRSLVRGLVNRLRMKIEPSPNSPQYIHTVPRIGYLFGDESE